MKKLDPRNYFVKTWNRNDIPMNFQKNFQKNKERIKKTEMEKLIIL